MGTTIYRAIILHSTIKIFIYLFNLQVQNIT